MPDTRDRHIYELAVDPEGYIAGVNAMAASTAKLTQEQERTNKTLQTNEAALKLNTERLNKAKADLEAYAGTNARYRKQLEGDVKSAEKDQAQLTELVNKNRLAYEQATKAAQDFANVSARAANIQQQAGGGKIPAPTVIPTVIPQVGAGIQDALKNISLGDLPETVNKTIPEFEALRTVIGQAKARMSELNAEDEEFKQLAPIVAQGEQALKLYDNATQQAAGSHQSLRTQLRLGREELVRMEQAGKGTSQEYLELEKRVAKLTDEFGDQQARIRILASDTKLLDFGKGAITAATSAFQAYSAVAILVGDNNEELQKKTMQLFAAMQLLQALEQLSNLTRREGVLGTLAASGAQSVYTAVVGASTGALKAFRLALLATGIGAAVVAIGLLVYKYNQWKEAAEKANAVQKLTTEITQEAAKSFASEVTHLELIKSKLDNLSIPQKQRIALAKEYNKTADEGNQIDLKQIDNISLVNSAIDTQIAKIKERAFARAAESVIAQAAEKVLLAEEEARIKNLQFSIDATKPIAGQKQNLMDQYVQGIKQQTFLAEQVSKDPAVIKAQEDLNNALNAGSKFITIGGLTGKPDKDKEDKKEIENVFEQERQKQRERLAELLRKSVEDEQTIRAEFEEQLKAEVLRINNLLKENKLTKPQAETLKIEAAKINTVGLDKALEDYRKKVADAREKINKETRDLQQKSLGDTLTLLQDEFDRRAALIDFNEKKELQNEKENTDERLRQLNFDRLLLGEQAYQKAKAEIIQAGEQEANNIIVKYAQERQQLSIDIFNDGLKRFESLIELSNLQLDESLSKDISALSTRFLDGTISYEKYQRDITNIQKKYDLERRQSTLNTEREELRALENEIAVQAGNKDLTEKQISELVKKRDELRAKIAKDQADIDQGAAGEDHNLAKQRADQVTEYANAIGQLTDSVIQFWQKANEAEQKALDRSIEIQQRRVDAAQRIAERGNAQYLKEEEDRLNELNVKRENAARKQLGIDAALQASQLLVAITGAISKIATPGVGIAETIGAIAVIVGSLATGYGLVKSLQGNQPKLAEGTTYVSRGKHPKGKDTIPAWLNEGEAVIPADKNSEYKKSIEAIYHGKVPAKTLNTFVEHYVSGKIKPVPLPNYSKFRDVAEMHVSHDGRVASLIHEQNKKIDENNDLQRQTLRAMKNMSVSATIDRDGVAIMVNEYMQQMLLDKKK